MDSLDILNDKLKPMFPGFSGFYAFPESLALFGLYVVPGTEITIPIKIAARELINSDEKAIGCLQQAQYRAEALCSSNPTEALKALYSVQ